MTAETEAATVTDANSKAVVTRARERHLKVLKRWLRVAITLAVVALGLILNPLYQRHFDRSILLEANSGAVEVTLSEEVGGKSFENAALCQRRDRPDFNATGGEYGCLGSMFEVVRPEGPFVLSFPAGTRLKFESRPGRLDIAIASLPESAKGTPLAKLESGRIILEGDGLSSFGHFLGRGTLRIGAPFGNVDEVPLIDANYQVNAKSVISILSLRGGPTVVQDGRIQSGAILTFTAANPPRDAESDADHLVPARVNIAIPDPEETGLMRVSALSDYTTVDLLVDHFLAEPILIRPSLIGAVANDPVLILMAFLVGGLIGFFQWVWPKEG
ncbi:hypothetical protein [Maritimibacter sp. DP1N21-5]|uniref:hypothetical protein n=1 Tax=Maritimibacter sp. DP1N21-5 TaxID=2836867 RepID=UPI001C43EF24|nr:hypothetical protein [Maritimibacter sp. DP1N21-5]MBV7408568.1 hypothetical protein [Maritimibacter sp. DP1N21-5]